MSDDLLKTPINEIINNRAKLLGLATQLFGRTSPSVIRAFGQFGRNPELAKIIEAKRNGAFDYGACIRDTSVGVVWPSDTVAVLRAIDKAEQGDLTVEDLIPIFRGDGDLAEEMFPRVYLKAPAPPKVKKPKVEPKVEVVPQPEPEVAAAPEVAVVENVVPFRASVQEHVNTKEKLVDSDWIETLFKTYFVTLAGDLDLFARDVRAAESAQAAAWSDLQASVEVLAHNQRILNENLRLVASCLGELPLQEIVVISKESLPQAKDSRAQAVSLRPKEVAPTVRVSLPPEPEPVVQAQPVVEPAASDEEELDVTEELLGRLDLAGLRELAVRLGINKADQLTYPKVLRKKIRAAVGLPPITD